MISKKLILRGFVLISSILYLSSILAIELGLLVNSEEKCFNIKPSRSQVIDEPIIITSNDDFITYGFPGEGTPESPYRIQNQHFQNSTSTLLSITDTDVDVIISNNIFDGINSSLGWYNRAIKLANVKFIEIKVNLLKNINYGILATESSEISISDNSFQNNGYGVDIQATNVSIRDNEFSNNLNKDISVAGSNWILDGNIINKTAISPTTIESYQLMVRDANNYTISNNWIYGKNWEGAQVFIFQSLNGTITRNVFSECYGVLIRYGTNITFTENAILNCSGYGMEFSGANYDLKVQNNDFVANNLTEKDSQIISPPYDDNLTFQQNYYDDWTYPDVDENGKVDNPYPLSTSSFDLSPRVLPYNAPTAAYHFLSRPRIIGPPFSSESFVTVLDGAFTIEWIPVQDSMDDDVQYTVCIRYYDLNTKRISDWEIIASDISSTALDWHTKKLPLTMDENRTYSNVYFKVIATCSEGIQSCYVSPDSYYVVYHDQSAHGWVFLITLVSLGMAVGYKKK